MDVTEWRDSNSSDVHRDANESGDECNWETASEDSDGDDDFVDAEDDRRHDVSVTQSAELHVTPVKDDIVNQTSALCSNGVVAKSENTPMPKSCTPSSANITQSVNDAAQTGTSDTNVIQSGNCDDQSGTEVRQSCKGVKQSRKWLSLPKKTFKKKSKADSPVQNSSSDCSETRDFVVKETSL